MSGVLRRLRDGVLCCALALLLLPAPAQAQFGKLLKQAAKQQAERKAIDAVTAKEGQVIDAALTGGPDSTAPPVATPAVAPAVASAAAVTATAAPASSAQAPAGTVPAADTALWVNYDFVPGDRVLYDADYGEDAVGNFPRGLVFRSGNLELVELGGRRLVRATGPSLLTIPLPEALPRRFTIEIDVINRPSLDGYAFQLQGGTKPTRVGKTSTIVWGNGGAGLLGGGGGEVQPGYDEDSRTRYRGKPVHVRVLGDGAYVKVYLDERRVVNVPNANFERSKALTLQIDARSEANPAFVGRIRVAASPKSICDDLAAKGRVATQGILFDVGSDQVRPESTPTLKEIAAMLGQHPELRLRIEGHTDDQGNKAANLELSSRRATAVAHTLADTYQVAPGRLEARGFGDSTPIARNNTSAGRQTNRRVELVRLPATPAGTTP